MAFHRHAAFAAIFLSSMVSTAALAGPIHSNVFTFQQPNGSPAAGNVVGAGQLNRTQTGVSLEISTTALAPGNAYTVWWIVFNNPAACAPTGCSGADLGNPAVNGSVLNATGGVADATGRAKFSAFLPVGFIHTNPSDEVADAAFKRHMFGPGLQNLKGAEIHAVIKSHGPANGQVIQISPIAGYFLNSPPELP
jgi:hypothetical protein